MKKYVSISAMLYIRENVIAITSMAGANAHAIDADSDGDANAGHASLHRTPSPQNNACR